MLFILPSISQGIALVFLWISFDFKGNPFQFHKLSWRKSKWSWRRSLESSKVNGREIERNSLYNLLEIEEMSLRSRFWDEREFILKSKWINFGICEELKGHLRNFIWNLSEPRLESKRIWRVISLFHLESKGKSKGSEGNPIWNLTEFDGKAKGIPFGT